MNQSPEHHNFKPKAPNLDIIFNIGTELDTLSSTQSFQPVIRVLGNQIAEVEESPSITAVVYAVLLVGYYFRELKINTFWDITSKLPDEPVLGHGIYETFNLDGYAYEWDVIGILYGLVTEELPVGNPKFITSFDVLSSNTHKVIDDGFALGKCIRKNIVLPTITSKPTIFEPPQNYELAETALNFLKDDSLNFFVYKQGIIHPIFPFINSLINHSKLAKKLYSKNALVIFQMVKEGLDNKTSREDFKIIQEELSNVGEQIDMVKEYFYTVSTNHLTMLREELDDLEGKIFLLSSHEDVIPILSEDGDQGSIPFTEEQIEGTIDFLRLLEDEKKDEIDEMEKFYNKRIENLNPILIREQE